MWYVHTNMLNYNCLHFFGVFRTLLLKISILNPFWAQNGGFGLRKLLNLITSVRNISGYMWNVHRNLLNYICLHFFGSFRTLLLKNVFWPTLGPNWGIWAQEIAKSHYQCSKCIWVNVKHPYEHVKLKLSPLFRCFSDIITEN